tara:strand:- start:11170 stop:11775 length:606 start_codon:yes stop_codon:yes gene_type:complete
MKNLMTTTAILVLTITASSAFADSNRNSNSNRNHNVAMAGASAEANAAAIAAQQQAQMQGQNQGQNQRQRQAQSADNYNNINMEGSVSASVGAASCANGVSIGAPGIGAIGGSWSDRDCKVVNEAAALAALGRTDLAISHMTHIPRVAETIRASQEVVSVAPVASVSAAYSFCGEVDGVFTVRVPVGGDAALASAQCMATR